MPSITKQEVVALFPLGDRQEVVAHLKSFDWDFSPRNIFLVSGDDSIEARQTGSGNVEGRAATILKPLGSWDHLLRHVEMIKARKSVFVAYGNQ